MPTICIPFASGVPAAGGPPVWWDTVSGSEPTFNERVDDPRWRGAMAISHPDFGSGTGELALFRGLHHIEGAVTSLYLQWHVKAGDNGLDFDDRLYLGLQRVLPAAGTAHVVRFRPFPAAADATADPIADTQTYSRSGAIWTALADEPDWLATYARKWGDTGDVFWAINVRIPLTAGADLDDTGMNLGTAFRIWFQYKVLNAGGTTNYAFPRGLTMTGVTGFPDPTGATPWADGKLGSGAADPACNTGIALSPIDVGTLNERPPGTPVPHEILYDRVTTPENRIFARPENRTGSIVTQNTVFATFRLANWGSLPDWNDVPDPTTLWTVIPNGTNVPNDADILPTSPIFSKGNCEFGWTLTGSEIDEFAPPGGGTPARRDHQCMLVELSGIGLTFINQSVYRNMDIVDASEFEREADISVLGLGAIGDPDRKVYLYVQTQNMPKNIEQKEGEQPPSEDSPMRGDAGVGLMRAARFDDREPIEEFDDIARRVPTCRIHVFHETGETETLESGRTVPVLRPQTSFGYFVRHEGPLFGWDAEIEGRRVREIAPNFYELYVPVDGVATVNTKIKAWEEPRPPEKRKGCLVWLLALIAGIVAAIRRAPEK